MVNQDIFAVNEKMLPMQKLGKMEEMQLALRSSLLDGSVNRCGVLCSWTYADICTLCVWQGRREIVSGEGMGRRQRGGALVHPSVCGEWRVRLFCVASACAQRSS